MSILLLNDKDNKGTYFVVFDGFINILWYLDSEKLSDLIYCSNDWLRAGPSGDRIPVRLGKMGIASLL